MVRRIELSVTQGLSISAQRAEQLIYEPPAGIQAEGHYNQKIYNA
jgi:hypothetical protein